MIWDSGYWKDDLLRQAATLRKRMRLRPWPERSTASIEKLIFVGFYSVRKLIEAKKLSTSLELVALPTVTYPPTGKNVTLMNWHKTDELFHLDRPRKGTITLKDLANQVIHSYVFLFGFTARNTLSTMLVCSDRQRSKGLYQVSLRTVSRVFQRVGRNYPHEAHWVFDPKDKDYRVHST